MGVWLVVLVVVVTGLVVARRWLPDASTIADMGYDLFRGLVPAPRPTVRVVTRRIARVCRRQRVAMPFGNKAVLPRAFVVDLSPEEYDVIEPWRETVTEAVGASLVRIAREKQWLCAGVPEIRLRSSEQVAEGRPCVDSTTLPPPPVRIGRSTQPGTALPAPAHAPALAPEPTQALDDTERAWNPPGRALAVAVDAEPTTDLLTAEPTGAEPIRAVHEYRLCSSGDEADIVVRDRPVVVGRATECDVYVHYPSASRRHLRLTPTAAGCRIEDLGSRHGTLINGRPVRAPMLLRPADTVQIGTQGPLWSYRPTYRAGDQPAPIDRRSGPVLREVR